MKRLALILCCCALAFAAGRLTAPVGTLTLGSGASLQGTFLMTGICITVAEGASNVSISDGRLEEGSCIWHANWRDTPAQGN